MSESFRCLGCRGMFRTQAGLQSHLRQTTRTRCQGLYMSSASEPSEPDLELGLTERFGFETSSESDGNIPIEPQGDYFGEYEDYLDDEWGLQPLASSPIYPGHESPAADPSLDNTGHILGSDSDVDTLGSECDELDNATAALECEQGWEPEFINSSLSSRLSSPAIHSLPLPSLASLVGPGSPPLSPPLVFTPSTSRSTPSSQSSSPAMVLSDMDDDDPITLRSNPYHRLTHTVPYITRYSNPLAGAPMRSDDNATHQQSTNDIYQVKLGETTNPYAPFSSEIDWGVARWAKLRGPSSTVFSELLKIPGVRSSHEILKALC